MLNAPLPANYNNGKPITNKQYFLQGWNAANAGIAREDCPYYPSSTAEKQWLKGHAS
jgi:ribosome modulation factor